MVAQQHLLAIVVIWNACCALAVQFNTFIYRDSEHNRLLLSTSEHFEKPQKDDGWNYDSMEAECYF